MKLKDYPEIVIDEFPKLYEQQTKVFITNLYEAESKLKKPPTKFCKMYTTTALARQLAEYLQSMHIAYATNDFCLVNAYEPFHFRVSNGTQLEAMFCEGNELGSSLMLLIRKDQQLKWFYATVQLDEMHRFVRQKEVNEWIRNGSEVLCLNVNSAEKYTPPVDFDAIAAQLTAYTRKSHLVICVPLFGYEYAIQQLAVRLQKRIVLLGLLEKVYKALEFDMKPFCVRTSRGQIFMHASCDYWQLIKPPNMERFKLFPLKLLPWTPTPTQDNLITLCSLLRPKRIESIVANHEQYVMRIPKILSQYRYYSTKKLTLEVAANSEANDTSIDDDDHASACQSPEKRCEDVLHFNKKHKAIFLESSGEESD